MRLPRFNYKEPRSIEEACSLLRAEPGARILSGGTDILVNMKHRVETPTTLVNIKRVPGLDIIEQRDGAITIGALTTLKAIYQSPLIAGRLPSLAEAALAVGSYHHQTMGTLGGNICQQNRCKFFNQSQWWRSARELCFKAGGKVCHVVNKESTCFSTYCGDVAPVLLTLNARAVVNGDGGARELALSELFSGDGKAPLTLGPGEILTRVIVPEGAHKGISLYRKLANRESIDFPIVGAALWASREGGQYRLAYTAAGKGPQRALKTEDFLKGKALSLDSAKEASAMVSKEASPVKTSTYSPSYKRRILGLLFESAMKDAIERLQEGRL